MVGTRPTRSPCPRRVASRSDSSRAAVREQGGGHQASRWYAGSTVLLVVGLVGQRLVEDLVDGEGADRHQPTIGHGAGERGPRQGDVRRQGGGGVRRDLGEVGAHGVDVAADDRTGQRSVALLEGVVERCGQQRTQGGRGVVDPGGVQQLHRLGDQGDQVVGAVGEPCVVERAHLLGHPVGAATEVGDQRRGDLALGFGGGEAEDAALEAVEVDGGAGEGHGRVHRDDVGADRGGRREDGEAVAAGGVHDVLALADRAAGGQHGDDVVEHVVGDRQQEQVAGPGHGAGLVDGDAWEEGIDAVPRGIGLPRGGHDVVSGGGQLGGQDRADASRADHTHAEALCHVEPFVPVPPTTRSS